MLTTSQVLALIKLELEGLEEKTTAEKNILMILDKYSRNPLDEEKLNLIEAQAKEFLKEENSVSTILRKVLVEFVSILLDRGIL